MFPASQLFTPPLLFGGFFGADMSPVEWLNNIAVALESMDEQAFTLPKEIPTGLVIEGKVFIAKGVKLPAYGVIEGPAYIGPGCELRPGVFIRGNVIVLENCVLGHQCEYKNALLLSGVQTAHFNYVGDSILGNGAHLGAGAVCANLRLDQGEVKHHGPTGLVASGRKKLGAFIGDNVEVGCNSVLQPGTVLGKGAMVGPALAYGGYLEAGARYLSQASYLRD